ncbi:MAG: endonuclease [Chitinophagaceae bacterium]
MFQRFTATCAFLWCVTLAVAQPPANYYNGTSGLSCGQLKTSLKNIINNGFNPQSYSALWTQYTLSDIKPREVGSGSTYVIWDIYSDNPTGIDPYNYRPGIDQCGSYSSENNCYNREHSIPQSWFNGNTSTPGPTTDYLHIFPTDGYVNGRRSNYPYGKVANATYTSLNGSKLGSSAVAGISGTVFEPLDSFKGDVARAFLYFVTMYQDNMTSWGNNTDAVPAFEPNSFPSVDVPYLQLMIQWHFLDPVSRKEIDRNNAAYQFQGNRNPYIDDPSLVTRVWNNSCPGLSSLVLPVQLQLFTGELKGNTIALQWFVQNEVNFSHYEIERSFNGTSFSSIGKVLAQQEKQYQFSDDVAAYAGTRIFYRLKMVDNDGSFSYSKIFTIHLPRKGTLLLTPNPAHQQVAIQIAGITQGQAVIHLFDITGRKVWQQNTAIQNGTTTIQVGHLQNGTYQMQVQLSNGTVYQQKLLVAHP